jgi:mannan endo-1,4-beta-mannosidase
MHLGTNDVWSNLPASTILDAYTTMLGQMRASNPAVKLIVARIIPMNPTNCAACGQRVVDLNNAIPGWAQAHTTTASPITVVDQWSGFNTATDTTDGVHPNSTTGIQKIESRWFPAVVAALPSGGGDTQPPSAPGTPTGTAVTSTSATLTWSASTDDVGVAGYDVYRATGASGGTFTLVGSPTTTTFTDTGLAASTTYRYQVRARDAAGNVSANSTSTTVVTQPGGDNASCKVGYSTYNWGGNGFTANVTVTNTGTSTINGWSLAFTFTAGQRVTQPGWGATFTQSGSGAVTATNLSWNGTLAPNASTGIGFNGTYTASNPAPTSFTLNGNACTIT